MEGGSRVYTGMSSKHETTGEEDDEVVEKLKAEVAEMKSKVRTNPEEVEAWFDKVNRSTRLIQERRDSSKPIVAALATMDDNNNATHKENNNNNNHISATVVTDLLKGGEGEDRHDDDAPDDDYVGDDVATGGQEQRQQQQQQQQQQEQELTELLEESAEVALDRISRLTLSAKDKLSPIARSGISQLNVFKEEGNDLKKLLSSREIIIYKTDAIAIMLRKYGGIIEFLDAYDNLIREGYMLDHSEAIESFFEIPINGIKTRLGKLYYFHHRKYAAATMPGPLNPSVTAVTIDDTGVRSKHVAAVFLKGFGSANLPSQESQQQKQ